jgi:hypothetical protein
MAKKKTAPALSPGTKVRVKPGIAMPEFPDILCEGWTGSIMEATGKKSDPKYVIEWDDPVVDALPKSYVELCEEKHFFYRMACFPGSAIEAAE